MADDDDSYAIDALGNRVLIGLSVEETEEFIRLDAIVGATRPLPHDAADDQYGPQESRWLELFEKHETARRRFLKSSKTVH
jgi:hypothetical protein